MCLQQQTGLVPVFRSRCDDTLAQYLCMVNQYPDSAQVSDVINIGTGFSSTDSLPVSRDQGKLAPLSDWKSYRRSGLMW